MRKDLSEPLDRACGHYHVAIGLAVSDLRPSIMTKISCSGYRSLREHAKKWGSSNFAAKLLVLSRGMGLCKSSCGG
jgi:hypothetical protein